MKYYGTISDPKDMVTKEYVDSHSGGGLSIDDVYPIGSIYMSVNSTDPSTLFSGTTWTRIQDTFLLAAGTNHSAGTTGGSEDAIVPYHRHSVSEISGSATTGAKTNGAWGFRSSALLPRTGATGLVGTQSNVTLSKSTTQRYSISNNNYTSAKTTGTIEDTVNYAGHAHTIAAHNTNSEGTSGNTVGANMPPYLAVYMWQRTS